MKRVRVVIMGAAGRDFHNFNVYFRQNKEYEVIAFTAAQIPDIEKRLYPSVLSGELYPQGIPIYSEKELPELIIKQDIDLVVFSYSDISHLEVMHKASQVMAHGASFMLLGPKHTMLKSKVPVISVCAVRTGAGKSQTTRRVYSILKEKGLKVVAVRHPMPYDGDITKQICQRFAKEEDLDFYNCTIEEREEYYPLIKNGIVVYAGVDYGEILDKAQQEADVIVWDGGNNDFPFFYPNLHIVLVDPHRAGHETQYHPGEVNLRMADVVIINKIDTALPENIEMVENNIKAINPTAVIIKAKSPVSVDNGELIKGKKVLVVEDGPTLTHGGMSFGAGMIAAKMYEAGEIIKPQPYSAGSIRDVYKQYSHLENILPAMGYSTKQIEELSATIEASPYEVLVIGTPFDLRLLLKLSRDAVRVSYELEEVGRPNLTDIIRETFIF